MTGSDQTNLVLDSKPTVARLLWATVGFVVILWALRIADYVTSLSWVTLFCVLAIGLGLFIIFVAVLSESHRSIELRWAGISALAASIILLGVWAYLQVYQIPGYGTDELAFDQYAGLLAAHWHNPYLTSMLPSFKRYGVSPNSYTFLLNGGVVSKLSYPALSFLFYVPFEWLGIDQQGAVVVNLIAWAVSIVLMYRLLPREFKALSVIVGSFSVYVGYAVGGVTDALFVPFAILAAYQWDRFGSRDLSFVRRYLSPVCLGLAMAIKQNIWLVLPLICLAFFLEDHENFSSHKMQRKKALKYLTITVVAFIIPNLPFIIDAPIQWFDGILQPVLASAVPAGQGIIGFSLYLGLGGGSLTIYTVIELLTVIMIVVGYAVGYRYLKQLAFFLPAYVFFFATRSFGSYFVTLLPALLISVISVKRSNMGLPKATVVRYFLGMLVVMVAFFGIGIIFNSPFQINIVSIHTTGEVQTVDQVTAIITNETNKTLRPYFSIQEYGTVTAFWNVSNNITTIGPRQTVTVILDAPNFYAMPPITGGFQLVAYTSNPGSVSTSSVFIAQQYHIKIYPDAINKLEPLGKVIPVEAQLVNQFNQPVHLSGIKIYFSQIVYGQQGLLPGYAVIYSNTDNEYAKYLGTSPVYGITNSSGQVEFYIVGKTVFRDPVYFEADLVNSTKLYPYGYSEILYLRFKQS